ncbi:hypothetical protein LY78DRAFT_682284 [Colletotrichum sublineola]|nr:hypothetical protein LY78DRAFT_682284 [Colletotrichum sublineola]
MVCETIVSQDVIIHFNPGIIIFMSLIKVEDLAEAVRSANENVPEFMEAMEISDAHSFFVFANKMLKWIPTEGVEANDMARPISRSTSSAGPFESSSRRPRISRTIQKCKPEAVDLTGYQFLQTRGLVVIENDLLSKVAVLPIGTAMVSLVKLSLVHVGQELKKGDEISTFLFGGSDTICVFESRADLKPKNCSFA